MATADVLDAPPPTLGTDDAEEIALAWYGLRTTAELLVSERDRNFRLTDASGTGWVLKVSNAVEDPLAAMATDQPEPGAPQLDRIAKAITQ